MQPVPMLSECEGQIRRNWADFLVIWNSIADGWRDHRREQWQKQTIDAIPSTLSLTTAAIAELRATALKAAQELADPDRQSEGIL